MLYDKFYDFWVQKVKAAFGRKGQRAKLRVLNSGSAEATGIHWYRAEWKQVYRDPAAVNLSWERGLRHLPKQRSSHFASQSNDSPGTTNLLHTGLRCHDEIVFSVLTQRKRMLLVAETIARSFHVLLRKTIFSHILSQISVCCYCTFSLG